MCVWDSGVWGWREGEEMCVRVLCCAVPGTKISTAPFLPSLRKYPPSVASIRTNHAASSNCVLSMVLGTCREREREVEGVRGCACLRVLLLRTGCPCIVRSVKARPLHLSESLFAVFFRRSGSEWRLVTLSLSRYRVSMGKWRPPTCSGWLTWCVPTSTAK